MKLAEALQERSDINKRISELRRRLENCLLVQEGEEPAEDPMDLLNELDSSTERLETLVASINETNCNTKVDGMSLTELIARKDALTLRHSAYKELVYTAGNNTYRARGTEIKVKAVIKAAELQKTVDSLAKEIRKLDNKLQETNWKTELVESVSGGNCRSCNAKKFAICRTGPCVNQFIVTGPIVYERIVIVITHYRI